MSTTIRSDASGSYSALQIGGNDVLRFGSDSSGQLVGNRNKIINGDMRIAQRGTTFAAAAQAALTLDRWQYTKSGAVIQTVSQSSDVPSSTNFKNSLKLQVTTADATLDAGDLCGIIQKIEGYNITDLIGKTFTISFWVKNTKTGIHCVKLGNTGADRSYIAEYTINVADTWEKKSITVVGGLITAGTWDYTNGLGLFVCWTLSGGSTHQTTPGSWQTGNYLATSNQVNSVDSTSNNFYITGVQLEVGSIATDFEVKNYNTEFDACRRYFQWCPFSITAYGTGAGWVHTSQVGLYSMRTLPTIGTIVADPALAQSGANLGAYQIINVTTNGATVYISSAASGYYNLSGYRAPLSAEL